MNLDNREAQECAQGLGWDRDTKKIVEETDKGKKEEEYQVVEKRFSQEHERELPDWQCPRTKRK